MSWFKNIAKRVKSVTIGAPAGEWAVNAMACVVYADGEAEEAELERAKEVVASNPVIADSLGANRGLKLFNDALAAIGTAPAAMLESYMAKLETLAKKVKTQEDKNFALSTVIAIAAADGEIEPSEHALLLRLRELIGATVEIPPVDSPG